MIKCKPIRSGKQTFLMIITFALLALATGAVCVYSDSWGIPPIIGQASFAVVIVVALYYMIKYTLAEIEYELSADTLTVVKYVGKKRTVMAALDLSMTKALVTKEEFKQNKKNYGYINKSFIYRQNPFGDGWIYIFEFSGQTFSMGFEPNPLFVKSLQDTIDNCKNAG